MAIKDCDHHHNNNNKKLIKTLILGILISLFIFILIILITWAVLRPTKPKFTLQDATVYAFNLSGPAQLTSTFQVTIQAQNPNGKIGIYYDRLISYATYHDQQITLSTGIPTSYQASNGKDIWSPFLRGESVPIAPYIGALINQDRSIGSVRLVIKLDGRVRWKVGSFSSGFYGVHVSCAAFIPFGSNRAASNGVLVGGNAVKYQLVQSCSVSV